VGIFALTPGIFITGIVNRFGAEVTTSSLQRSSGKLAAAKQVIERTAKLLRKLETEFPASNLTTFKGLPKNKSSQDTHKSSSSDGTTKNLEVPKKKAHS